MSDVSRGKSPHRIFPTECFSSGSKQARMSIEDSFEKGHRRLYLEQEVVARSEGPLFQFIQQIISIMCRVAMEKNKAGRALERARE